MWNLIFIIASLTSTDYVQYVDGVYESKVECVSVIEELAANVREDTTLVIVADDFSHVYATNEAYKVDMLCKEV